MARSESSSEMSDSALRDLVSRLVQEEGDLGREDVDALCVMQVGTNRTEGAFTGDVGLGGGDAEPLDASDHEVLESVSPPRESPARTLSHSPGANEEPEVCIRSSAEASASSLKATRKVLEGSFRCAQGEEFNLLPAMLKHTEAETDGNENEEVGQIPEVLRTDDHPGSPAATSPSESPATGEGGCLYSSTVSERIEGDWQAINEILQEEGFGKVTLSSTETSPSRLPLPDLADLAKTLRHVLFRYREAREHLREVTLESRKREQKAQHRDEALNESLRRVRVDFERHSSEAEGRIAQLKMENSRLREELTKETRRFRTRNVDLSLQLKHSEHRAKVREKAAQSLMDRLECEVENERRYQQQEREMMKKSHTKHAQVGGGRWGELRVSEVLRVQGKANERAEAEVTSLRAEIARLGEELRERENTILRCRLASNRASGASTHDVCGVQHLSNDASCHELKKLREDLATSQRVVRILKAQDERVRERCADISKDNENIQAELEATKESLANAQLELSSRPSLRNWHMKQQRIQDLEKRLSRAKSEVKEAVEIATLRQWVDTRELIRRDRENHKFKLETLDELPTNVMKQVVQDACRLLGLEDVSLLGPSVGKLIKAVQVLPRLERFVNSACCFVFQHSRRVLADPSDDSAAQFFDDRNLTMEDVLPLLKLWLVRVHQSFELKAKKICED